jgi:hypothetical protein
MKVGESQNINKGKKKESEVQKEAIQTAQEESTPESNWRRFYSRIVRGVRKGLC